MEAQAFGLNQCEEPVSQLCYSLHIKDPKEGRRRVAIEDFEIEKKIEITTAIANTNAYPGRRVPELGLFGCGPLDPQKS